MPVSKIPHKVVAKAKPAVAHVAASHPTVAKAAIEKKELTVPKAPLIKGDYLFAVGKRKSATARVRMYLKENSNEIKINGKDFKTYFPYFEWQNIVELPLKKVNLWGKHLITIHVKGGGVKAQAEAVRHGLAKLLLGFDETWRKTLRSEGWLTRDPREKERKKPGLKRARRAPQWQKR